MKKLLLLGALFATAAMQAQTTYYWPGERVSELTSGNQYFIYNTTQDNGDRSWFLYSNGSALKTNNISPKEFVTNDNSYLFQTIKPDAPTANNHWYLKSAHGYTGIAGVTNNTDARDLYISYWYGNDNILKGSGKSEDTDGTYQNPNDKDTKVWAITKGSEKNPNDKDNTYAWNGNASDPGLGDKWTTWANAHPYAFYSVESKEISDAANDAYQALLPLINNMYTLQRALGLIQDASQLSTNAQEQSEGPIANLIDGDETTYFHSSWNNDPAPDAPHYIQVALKEPVKAFYFYFKKRSQNNNNRPTSIKISTSTDGTNFTELTTISDGLVAASDYMSSKIESATEFNYVRFEVLSTNSGSHFFSMSEFYLLNADYEQVAAVKDINYIKSTSSEKIESTCTAWKNKIQNTAAYQELQQTLKEVESIPWGSGLNQFSKAENYDSAVETAKSITSGSSLESMQSATAELNNILSSKVINQPETGKFYRFKSATLNNYISSTTVGADNRPVMTDNPDEAVFYLTADSRLITMNLKAMNNYNPVAGLGEATTFKASQAIVGNYAIRNNAGSYFAKATGEQMDRHGDETTGLNTKDCAWIIEEVTETAQQPSLNKTMSAEYATLAAPVALNIPEGVKAYTVTLDEEKATATLEEVSNVIPAGTAVVLKKTGNGSDFTFTFAAEGSTSNTNALTGVYADTEIATDINAYILGQGEQGIGFYQMNGTDRTLGANKAYLTLPATVKVRSIIFSDGQTTGIESTVAEDTEAEEYYDLQGRRVMNPTKGIYVTKSGKKVVINK